MNDRRAYPTLRDALKLDIKSTRLQGSHAIRVTCCRLLGSDLYLLYTYYTFSDLY